MRKISGVKSIEAEAEFWDTQDTEEFANEFELVDVKFARHLKHKPFLR